MKYKVGDVVKFATDNDERYDLIVEVDESKKQYVAWQLITDTRFRWHRPEEQPYIWHYDKFERAGDVIETDPDINREINKQYKTYQLQTILSK